MKTNTIDLAALTIIPKEGFMKPNGSLLTVELFSADLGAANIAVTMQGSVSGENWDTLQNNGEDISLTLVSGVALVESFEVNPALNIRFNCATGTGSVQYFITD